MATLTFLFPPLAELRGTLKAAPQLARRLAQADALAVGKPGREAQLLRHFEVLPRRIAAAPITRALDAGDAKHGAWLRADPAYVRADLGMGRMLACGGMLGLAAAEAEQLIAPLRTLFGDEGFPLSAPHPDRWYLMLPADSKLPPLAEPDDVLGDDLHAHLPEGAAGARWRRLLNEAQIILHNHPLNAERIAKGKLPVNSVWFWGAGVHPDQVKSRHSGVQTADALVAGLCRLAGVNRHAAPELVVPARGQQGLIDLRSLRDVADIERELLPQVLQLLAQRDLVAAEFDCADGRVWRLQHAQRWRIWKRPLRDPTGSGSPA